MWKNAVWYNSFWNNAVYKEKKRVNIIFFSENYSKDKENNIFWHEKMKLFRFWIDLPTYIADARGNQ